MKKPTKRNFPEPPASRWAEAIVAYYSTHRGTGSTYHQEHGWLAPCAGQFTKVVVMPYHGSTPMIDAARNANVKVVPLSVDPLYLSGLNGPLVVEHSALAVILRGLLRELRLAREREYRAKRRAVKK